MSSAIVRKIAGKEMVRKKIGLAGKSGSGKDVVADYICDRYGYDKIAVADPIRDEVALFLRGVLGDAFVAKEFPASFDVVVKAFAQAVCDKPTTPEIRILLQWWGTEYRRSQDFGYWVKLLSARLQGDRLTVISDVRIPDEMQAVRDAGGEVWYVERPGVGSVGMAQHLTEIGLDGAAFDRQIMNDGTLDELQEKLDWIFHEC